MNEANYTIENLQLNYGLLEGDYTQIRVMARSIEKPFSYS